MFVKNLRALIMIMVILSLTACSKTFVVVSEVPRPLVESTELKAKMIYSAEFRDYDYLEEDKKRALEKVSFGASQVDLFDRVFGALFELVTDPDETADLIIEPQVLDFQYSIPDETKTSQFEIWLKYRLKIEDNESNPVADWVVKGYGKTPTTMLGSHLKSFNTAANMAMRDVGAQLAVGFRTQPSIEDFLNRHAKLEEEPKVAINEVPTVDEELATPVEEQ